MSNSTVSPAPQKSQPVRNIQAIIAAASAIVAGLSGVAYFSGQEWVAGVSAIWGLLMLGYNAYQGYTLPQKVVPFEDTAAYVNAEGDKVAGPASPLKNGTVVNELESTTAHAALSALEGQNTAKRAALEPNSYDAEQSAETTESVPSTATEQQPTTDTK